MTKKNSFYEYSKSIAIALVFAFFIRSFDFEMFKIPTGSMIPTVMIGDRVVANKFVYGLRIPFTKKRLVTFSSPARGDVIVFIAPPNESIDFLKRVIGLPGDKIHTEGEDVYINGQLLTKTPIAVEAQDAHPQSLLIPEAQASQLGVQTIPYSDNWKRYHYSIEKIGQVNHLVQFEKRPFYDPADFEVPAGHLFVMGDNRDDSADSRDWGFVPLENIKGKAMFVGFSVDYGNKNLRWNRFGKKIH